MWDSIRRSSIYTRLLLLLLLGGQGLNCLQCGTLSEDPLSIQDCDPSTTSSVRKTTSQLLLTIFGTIKEK